MRENGIPTASRFDGIMTIGKTQAGISVRSRLISSGVGFPIQIKSLHDLHRRRIEASQTDSRIWTNTSVVKLVQEHAGVPGSGIKGAIIRRYIPDSPPVYYNVQAKVVVLATGGFQGSSRLRALYLGEGGDSVFLRSNQGSVGDGLSLATDVGAGTSRGMNTYYGHLLAAPLRAEDVSPKDFLPLAQYREFAHVHIFRMDSVELMIDQKANSVYY